MESQLQGSAKKCGEMWHEEVRR